MTRARMFAVVAGLAVLAGGIQWAAALSGPDGGAHAFDEASVYSAVLDYSARLGKLLPYSPADYRWRGDARFLIHSQSFVPRLNVFASQSYCGSLQRVLPIGSRIWRDFLRRNTTPAAIPPVLSSGVPFTLVTLHPGERLLSDSRLGRQYPGVVGVFVFSRVGFAASGNEALVHLAGSVEPDARGSFLLLRLAPNAWKVAAYENAP